MLRAGILIIGSLYWDDSFARVKWRQERLDLSNAVKVGAPIRYGRKSSTRGNSFTMVFSKELPIASDQTGTAIYVPFKRELTTSQDLVEEAEFLWGAEQNKTKLNGNISANWGCVGLGVNPNSYEVRPEFKNAWAKRISREAAYPKLEVVLGEEAVVDGYGILTIKWPDRDGGRPLAADYLLATATNPTLIDGIYPSAKQIAEAWLSEKGKEYVDYFWKNRANGISTHQDDEITGYLNARKSD